MDGSSPRCAAGWKGHHPASVPPSARPVGISSSGRYLPSGTKSRVASTKQSNPWNTFSPSGKRTWKVCTPGFSSTMPNCVHVVGRY